MTEQVAIDPDGESVGESSEHALLNPLRSWRELEERIFGSNSFFRLWLAQVVTSVGDWLFFLAVLITAARVGGEAFAAGAVGSVVAARIVPSLFLSQVAGVLADRWDRRKLMVTTDIARAGVVLSFPFIEHVWQLVAMSLAVEIFAMLWIPAKEASVPNLVPKTHLTTANSLAVLATYGTVLPAAGLFFAMGPAAEWLSGSSWLDFLHIDTEALAFYVDSSTFLISALLIASLPIGKRVGSSTNVADNKIEWSAAWTDFKEGWALIASDRVVRAVNVGMATAMIGGGMLIPLGSIYAPDVLDTEGQTGFVSLCAALAFGAIVGVVSVSLLQHRIDRGRTFVVAVFGVAIALLVAATLDTFAGVMLALVGVGLGAALVYVTGYTLLHETVTDELRGRVFATLYSLTRACVALALIAGPFLAVGFDQLANAAFGGSVDLAGYEYVIPGVRITLWVAALIIFGAGVLASWSFRGAVRNASRDHLRAVK